MCQTHRLIHQAENRLSGSTCWRDEKNVNENCPKAYISRVPKNFRTDPWRGLNLYWGLKSHVPAVEREIVIKMHCITCMAFT
jgi:hypothetical protein